jgi:hypothetical protein
MPVLLPDHLGHEGDQRIEHTDDIDLELLRMRRDVTRRGFTAVVSLRAGTRFGLGDP